MATVLNTHTVLQPLRILAVSDCSRTKSFLNTALAAPWFDLIVVTNEKAHIRQRNGNDIILVDIGSRYPAAATTVLAMLNPGNSESAQPTLVPRWVVIGDLLDDALAKAADNLGADGFLCLDTDVRKFGRRLIEVVAMLRNNSSETGVFYAA